MCACVCVCIHKVDPHYSLIMYLQIHPPYLFSKINYCSILTVTSKQVQGSKKIQVVLYMLIPS